jgi:hypothetical protein
MGIELHQHEIGVLFRHSRDRTRTDGMLTAKHQRLHASSKNGPGGMAHGIYNGLRIAVWNLNGSNVGVSDVFEISIQLGAVGLKTCAHLTNRGWAKSCARAE